MKPISSAEGTVTISSDLLDLVVYRLECEKQIAGMADSPIKQRVSEMLIGLHRAIEAEAECLGIKLTNATLERLQFAAHNIAKARTRGWEAVGQILGEQDARLDEPPAS